MRDISDRLRWLRESKKLKQIDAAQLISVGYSTLQQHEGGLNPGRTTLKKYSSFYGCDLDWLITGKGQPFGVPLEPLPEYTGQPIKPFIHPEILERERKEREGPDPIQGHMEEFFNTVPLVECRLSAGYGHVVESERVAELYAFRKTWLRKATTAPENVKLLMVEGDSMEPLICDGDMVMIDLGRRNIAAGRIYAIGVGDTIMIKRLELMPDDRVKVASFNKEYEPYIMDGKDLRIIGQIIWFARELVKLELEK